MTRRGFVAVTSPGLPPWPRLFFNREKNIAVVSVRHATWRSYEWAIRTSTAVMWLANGVIAFLLWKWVHADHPILKLAMFALAIAVLFPIAKWLIPRALRGFLARRVFATRTSLWSTPSTIAFRSRFYSKPVVIWRIWKSQKVNGKFILNRDIHAVRYATDDRKNNKHPRSHLDEAMILEIVISATNAESPMTSRDQGVLQRTIPITELNGQLATKFTMVFAAAAMLTQVKETKNDPRRSVQGIDIDN